MRPLLIRYGLRTWPGKPYIRHRHIRGLYGGSECLLPFFALGMYSPFSREGKKESAAPFVSSNDGKTLSTAGEFKKAWLEEARYV